ncbi:hypothetical protein GOODEAATRI_009113 [Goodea atripinnis]|uniref:Uncharacterized protein n=1 Tax=Goodea atripinnis TaxID=208336 RepID=A0ABV0N963_9TELE
MLRACLRSSCNRLLHVYLTNTFTFNRKCLFISMFCTEASFKQLAASRATPHLDVSHSNEAKCAQLLGSDRLSKISLYTQVGAHSEGRSMEQGGGKGGGICRARLSYTSRTLPFSSCVVKTRMRGARTPLVHFNSAGSQGERRAAARTTQVTL